MVYENHPRCFVITLKGHELSESLASECIQSGYNNGWNIETFDAINGRDVTAELWQNIGVSPAEDRYNMKLPGVQGCFLSHFSLWTECLRSNQEIIILEHDAIIHAPWDSRITNKNKLVKLMQFRPKKGYRQDPESGTYTTGLVAYLIHPAQAQRAVDFCRKTGALPADVVMGSNVVDFEHLDYKFVTMNKTMRKKSNSTTNNL